MDRHRESIRAFQEGTSDFIAHETLKDGSLHILFHYLFWNPCSVNVQGDVHREVLEFMLRRGYTDANPQFSQDRAGEVIDKLVMADLVEKRDDGRGNLLLSPTLRGAKLLRTANLPPRPIEVFLRDMAKHKVAIVATILGISSGAIAVYEFLRERFTNH